jgi:hypothetical protein
VPTRRTEQAAPAVLAALWTDAAMMLPMRLWLDAFWPARAAAITTAPPAPAAPSAQAEPVTDDTEYDDIA